MYHYGVTLRERLTQSLSVLIALEVISGVVFGITLAALLNRFLDLFLWCVFLGAIAAGALTLILNISSRKGESRFSSDPSLNKVVTSLAASLATITTFAFLATLPINVDRSFSVWALNEMDRFGEPQSRNELILKSANFFSPNSGEISRRINEQIELKNIEVVGNYLRLTERGKLQVQIHRIIRKVFALNIKYTR